MSNAFFIGNNKQHQQQQNNKKKLSYISIMEGSEKNKSKKDHSDEDVLRQPFGCKF